jgi:hypothetical protein
MCHVPVSRDLNICEANTSLLSPGSEWTSSIRRSKEAWTQTSLLITPECPAPSRMCRSGSPLPCSETRQHQTVRRTCSREQVDTLCRQAQCLQHNRVSHWRAHMQMGRQRNGSKRPGVLPGTPDQRTVRTATTSRLQQIILTITAGGGSHRECSPTRSRPQRALPQKLLPGQMRTALSGTPSAQTAVTAMTTAAAASR